MATYPIGQFQTDTPMRARRDRQGIPGGAGDKKLKPHRRGFAGATLSASDNQRLLGNEGNFLSEELEAIKPKIDPETWNAIETVRQIGGIGKHMEKGVNLLMDGEPNEAEVLLGLIDYLIEEWYVARQKRQERLIKIKGFRTGDAPKIPPVPEKNARDSKIPND